ncbi:MAG: error-prone DNA polymerase [Chloroflexi bacterium]|nr:error-prone DNA polymerase [Chloroflexota bacterium]
MPPYIELHCHSNFSFLEGASHVEEAVLRARDLGYEALALTDHDGLHGAMEFAQCARAWGLRPITGAEVTLAPPSPPAGNKEQRTRSKEHGAASCSERQVAHLTLLCETQRGYANLCRLLSHAHLDHPRGEPWVEPEVLANHAEGLIALSGCRRGEVPSLVAQGRYREAEEAARRYLQWFAQTGARSGGPGNFFIELQDNLVHGDARRNRALADLAEHLGVGTVATGNVHYHVRERHRLQDVLVAIKHRTTLDASHRLRRENSEYYLKPPEEMAERWRDYPEAIANTLRIAERCQFDLTRDLDYRFPDYPVPAGETPDSYLRKLCYREAELKYGRIKPQVRDRLEEELALVERHGLAGFFLLHREILQLAYRVAEEVRGRPSLAPPGRGRGSSVGSVICYLIGLSHIDPIANNLFLGRFLNEEMASVPDIDLDFPRDIREKLILRIYEHFGKEHVGLVATFPTYRIRGAVREVGKALGLPPAELDRLAKVSEGGSARSIREEMARLAHYRDKLNAPLWRHLADLVEEIAGFPRHISQHVGGMVISSKPLVELVPLEQSAMPGRVLMQWDKDSVDDARMIKIDFLALGMLSAVDECLDLIEQQRGKRIDLSRIDFQDERVYDSICRADTMGVFQVESRAQMQTLPRVRPRSLDDLTVEVAIIRPGPIVGGAVNPYIRRRLGREPVTYDHPSLEPVLTETLGVVLFQEQVLQVAMALAGFSAGQAESLRRAMSRKRSREAIAKLKQQFIEGCLGNGVSQQTAETVFAKIAGFAEFGFPKAHAAAFGLLAYQSAWLRTYYPAESLCALFNAQPMGFYGPHVLVNDGKRHGVDVLPPDINRSGANCTVEVPADDDGPPILRRDRPLGLSEGLSADRSSDLSLHSPGDLKVAATPLSSVGAAFRPPAGEGNSIVRIGFRYVKGMSEATAREVEEGRGRGGEFRSLFDFVERTRLKREAIENLIACGAFDCFGLERRELLWQLGLVYRSDGRNAAQRQLALPLPTEQDMPGQAGFELAPMTEWDRMVADYAVLGLSPSYHPMAFLRPGLHEGVVPSNLLPSLPDGASVDTAGMVVCRQRPGTAKGFVFLVLEDEFGLMNVVVKPGLYERQRSLVRTEPFLLVHGTLERRDGTVNVAAKRFTPLRPNGAVAPEAHNFG